MYYSEGGFAGFGRESFNRLETWLTYTAPPDVPAISFATFGFGLTLLARSDADAIPLVELAPRRLCDLWELGD